MLAVLLCGILGYEGAWAQAVPAQPGAAGFVQTVEEAQRVLPGDYAETPEDIIVAAMELYSWFTISPLDVDPDLISADGFLYRVADEELCRNEVIMQLLSDTFSAQIIEEMMMYEVYTVIDGMLYTTAGGGRGIDQNISFVEYEETYSDEQKIVYRVVVHYHGEAEFYMLPDEFEFIREKIDDKWLFTQFIFFW
jgi:hypothetical protein